MRLHCLVPVSTIILAIPSPMGLSYVLDSSQYTLVPCSSNPLVSATLPWTHCPETAHTTIGSDIPRAVLRSIATRLALATPVLPGTQMLCVYPFSLSHLPFLVPTPQRPNVSGAPTSAILHECYPICPVIRARSLEVY